LPSWVSWYFASKWHFSLSRVDLRGLYLGYRHNLVGPEESLNGSAAAFVHARGWPSVEVATRAHQLIAAVDACLTEAGIEYVLADGSLLGLCRGHEGGFMPWDDDIDMVPRLHFERLQSQEMRTKLLRRGVILMPVVRDMYKARTSIYFPFQFI
jgi:hypothetical protein